MIYKKFGEKIKTMEIEGTPKHGYQYKLLFDKLDRDVVECMETERIHEAAKEGTLEELEDIGNSSTAWKRRKEGVELFVKDLSIMAKLLEDFYDNTAEAIKAIPEITGIPAHVNDYISERLVLGRHAIKLATQLRNEEIARSATADLDAEARIFFSAPLIQPE